MNAILRVRWSRPRKIILNKMVNLPANLNPDDANCADATFVIRRGAVEESDSRYIEFEFANGVARVEFRDERTRIRILHTMVSVSLRGSGCGKKLVRFVLNEAIDRRIEIIADCSYAAHIIENDLKNLGIAGGDEVIGPAVSNANERVPMQAAQYPHLKITHGKS